MQFYCDVCCSEFVWSDGSTVYCDGAERVDWVADSASPLYVIHADAVAVDVLVCCLIVLREVLICRCRGDCEHK